MKRLRPPKLLRPAYAASMVRRLVRHPQRTQGLRPGAVVHVGDEQTHDVTLCLARYDGATLEEKTLASVEEAVALREARETVWINVDGVHDTAVVEALGEGFGIHPLIQEDIANTTQRAKCEVHDGYLYVVLPMLTYEADHTVRAEQVSLLFGDGWILSFLEDPGDLFDPVRERLRVGRGRIRTAGADYLAFALTDVIVDGYFVALEGLGDVIEILEAETLADPDQATQQRILSLRRELIFMRRSAWPVRELLSQIDRSESPLIEADTRPFFRDTYDHAVQVIDIVESMRDLMGGLMDLYMSSLSNRMNEVMKFLTIVGTIFIPLTFVAGIYGMNFDRMPELHARYGYPIAVAAMLLIAVGLVLYFKKRRWL